MGLISKPAKTEQLGCFRQHNCEGLVHSPAGARPLRFLVDVDTAFNDSGTDLLTLANRELPPTLPTM